MFAFTAARSWRAGLTMATAAIATRRATSWALALSGVAGAFAADAHAAIRSSRGVQHQTPMISDDFIVGCIMVMFLCLFAFGTRRSVETTRSIAHRCALLRTADVCPCTACTNRRQAMTRLSAFGCSGSREDPAHTHELFESVPFALLHHTTCVSYRSNCTTTTTAPKINTTHQIGTCSSARAPTMRRVLQPCACRVACPTAPVAPTPCRQLIACASAAASRRLSPQAVSVYACGAPRPPQHDRPSRSCALMYAR